MQTMILKKMVPKNRRLEICLPASVPIGKTELFIVVSSPTPNLPRTNIAAATRNVFGIWKGRRGTTLKALRRKAWRTE
jgi:hypothetical protein